MSDRLHKVLAQHGLGSRREIERWIVEGRVKVNGELAQEGARFNPGDRVAIDGNDVTARLRSFVEAPQVIVYHKAQHQPVSAEAEHEDAADSDRSMKSVMDSLPAKRGTRWLVINTMQAGDSGLLLLTTDGRLANALRRHATTIPAAYVARVLIPDPEFDVSLFPLEVRYDEVTIAFTSIEAAGGEGVNRWFLVEAAHSHRRAAVRALFESRGLGVSRVSQVKFASIDLPRDLPRDKHKALSKDQVRQLYSLAELPVPEAQDESRPARAKTSAKSKVPRFAADRSSGHSGRRPGGKGPTRARVKPGGAAGTRKTDR